MHPQWNNINAEIVSAETLNSFEDQVIRYFVPEQNNSVVLESAAKIT